MTTISDNPGAATGLVGAFVAALLAMLNGLGVLHLTVDQVTLILAFASASMALGAWLLHILTVPKTPSSVAAPIQTPPPGTVLVDTVAANAPGPVGTGNVVAGPTPTAP